MSHPLTSTHPGRPTGPHSSTEMPEQILVREFHRTFDFPTRSTPTLIPQQEQTLRLRLIDEELTELKEAMAGLSLHDIAKELGDLLYVVLGTAEQYGFNMKPIIQEIHRSNMTKQGGYKRADGKWIKPNTYSKADLTRLMSPEPEQSVNPASLE